jgi:hypothetical protein
LREDKKLLIFASPYIERDAYNDEPVNAYSEYRVTGRMAIERAGVTE